MRVLIVRLSAMGDIVHALPLAANARAAGATVGWAVERPFADLLEGNPDCSSVFVAETRRWRASPLSPATWRSLASFRAALRAFRPDFAIDAQGNWKSAIVAWSAGAPVAGLAASERREPTSALLCALPIRPGRDARHVVDQNLGLLAPLGIPIRARAPDARYLLARPNAEAAAFLAEVPKPFAVFHPGAGRVEKIWGEGRFARLAAALSRSAGAYPVISWGPGDEERATRLGSLLPGASRLPRLDLAGLAHVFAASALVVAGDTGPLHLADAVGATPLALFELDDPDRNSAERNGPYRNRDHVVVGMRDAADAEVLERAIALLRGGQDRPGSL